MVLLVLNVLTVAVKNGLERYEVLSCVINYIVQNDETVKQLQIRSPSLNLRRSSTLKHPIKRVRGRVLEGTMSGAFVVR